MALAAKLPRNKSKEKSSRYESSAEENLGRGEAEKGEEGEGLSWGDWGNMSGEKLVEVERINLAKAATR